MKILILTHFDVIIGPNIFFQAPGEIDEKILEQIPSLMNLYDEKGFFIHISEIFKSANLIFEIPNESGRGGAETLLISLIITDGNINIDLTLELLKSFAKIIKNLDNAFEAFYIKTKKFEGSREIFAKIQELFFTFYKSIPEESVIRARRDAKIFVFGLSQAGKTTIIQALHKAVDEDSLKTVPTTNVAIQRVFINNISILTYDVPGQEKLRTLWGPYLSNQDALVFVLDVVHKIKYKEAKEILHQIAKNENLKHLPLLVLYNKIDLAKPDIKALDKAMVLEELGERPLQSYMTSGFYSSGIIDAFSWLAEELSRSLNLPQRQIQQERIEEGLIFSRWDESSGLELITVCPEDAFSDPEVIAIRCFSISQTIFSGEKFKQVSFVLPFPNLKAKAAIYFDSIFDRSVRGGKLPLSLVIFYNQKNSKAFIERFNTYVFQQFEDIKENFGDKQRIIEIIQETQEFIKEKIKESIIKGIVNEKGETDLKETKLLAEDTDFEEYTKDLKMEDYFKIHAHVLNKEETQGLRCEICHNDIKLHVNVYQSEFDLGFVCDDCYLSTSKEDIEMMMHILNGYGGYFGKERNPKDLDSKIISELTRIIKSRLRKENNDDLMVRMLHKAFLKGITPEIFNKNLISLFN